MNGLGKGEGAVFGRVFGSRVSASLVSLGLVTAVLGGSLPIVAATPGATAWAKRHNSPGNGEDWARRLVMSPDGTKVFVTGSSTSAASGWDFLTVAYRVSDGALLWARRYNGPGNGQDDPTSVAVSPDGTSVFVTGRSYGGATTGYDAATIAFNAATGATRWVKRYNGSTNVDDGLSSVVVSADGGTVFGTGGSSVGTGESVTVAYAALTGAQLWVKRYGGMSSMGASTFDAVVSPDSDRVYVTGILNGGAAFGWDFVTIAYRGSDGAVLWAKRYASPGNSWDQPWALAVSADGTKLFVTGASGPIVSGLVLWDMVTIAYSASTGASLWAKRYDGPANGEDLASAVAVSPDGATVFVTGASRGNSSSMDIATLAYAASTGATAWVKRYNGPGNGHDEGIDLAVVPDGSKVVVTGSSAGSTSGDDYATIAYQASTGAGLWARRYSGPGTRVDVAYSIAASPDGTTLVITGLSTGATTGMDYATIAYNVV